jgi:hypothetical protein
MDQVVAVFAEAYTVAKSGGTYTVYFFQSHMPDRLTGEGQTTTSGRRHKCIGRIVLANQDSLDKFLWVLAKNRGATIQFSSASKPEKEAPRHEQHEQRCIKRCRDGATADHVFCWSRASLRPAGTLASCCRVSCIRITDRCAKIHSRLVTKAV